MDETDLNLIGINEPQHVAIFLEQIKKLKDTIHLLQKKDTVQ